MSEPLSSTEIEDVLSSIRRLVSDDIRPAVRVQPVVAPVAGDKLILTPALRVVETPAEATAPPMFVAVPRVQHSAENSTDFGQVVASVGAAVDAAPDDWEAEAGDALVSEKDFAAAWGSSSAEEEVAVVQLASAESDHFEYQDTVVDAPAVEAPKIAAVAEDVAAWAQQDGLGDVADEEETVIHNGMVEPDPVWADAAAASVIAGLADPVAEADDEEDDDFSGEMRFNEDVLRELVRDILREELAGKMGERITRNIRKLVRTEISRAMMTQDIE